MKTKNIIKLALAGAAIYIGILVIKVLLAIGVCIWALHATDTEIINL